MLSDGGTVEDLLRNVLAHGAEVLHRATADAVARHLSRGGAHGPRLWNDSELADVAAALAATNAAGELLGRSLVRDLQQRELAAHAGEDVTEALQGGSGLAVPVVLQRTDYSCGRACFVAVCRFLGLDPDADTLAALGTDPRDGTRPAEILALGRALGLAAEEGHDLTVEDLAHALSEGAPVLCAVQMHGGGHWVVACGIAPDAVCLMDPVGGLVTVPRAEFEAAWHDVNADGVPYTHYGIALGRSGASALFEGLEEDAVPPLKPEEAVRHYRALVPTLGVDPLRFGAEMRRAAFTLAVATDAQLLGRVQTAIGDLLDSGDVDRGPKAVAQILDQAGVSPANPQYAEMVFRTNAIDSYNTGAWKEMRDPDVADFFPVWKYSNPCDDRSRPEHAERDGNYYPSDVSFEEIRGTDAEDVCNCRCTFIPISKWQWKRLQASGAELADGYSLAA